ncbi:cytochrome p450 domain-containing protein [Ditylenchus destructor]|uniref:Cytochrome p450 domain-containing protein n=1 Tax=Ditylenchus destructor TaxID=166010 RepID=A0AAD4R059_9BILA|nr:cytochrome p450 domain-containing protein [Ditylenchus destructor]
MELSPQPNIIVSQGELNRKGPTPWPIWGNIPELSKESPAYGIYSQWTQKYGPVFTIWIWETAVVIVTDYNTMRESFAGRDADAYTGADFMVDILKLSKASNGPQGILNTDGERWSVLRRATLQILRTLGLGGNEGEKIVLEEVDSLLGSVDDKIDKGQKVIDLMSMLQIPTASIIHRLLFSYPFSNIKCAEFRQMKSAMKKLEVVFFDTKCLQLMQYTWLRHLPTFSAAYRQIDSTIEEFFVFIDKQIKFVLEEQAKESKDERNSTEQNCFVEQFMRLIDAQESDESESYFTMDALRGLCFNFITAGDETIRLTMSFVLLYLTIYQDVQAKLQAELDSVIGSNRAVTLADKPRLPYLNAVIMEAQRLCNLFPFNLIHKTTREVVIGGHKLPAGTRIIPQVSCVLYNEKAFPCPEAFRPERFLTPENRAKRVDEFIPFSIGKRMCPGESLTKMELFLMTANIFNRFTVLPEDSSNSPSIKKLPGKGSGVSPLPFLCKIQRR